LCCRFNVGIFQTPLCCYEYSVCAMLGFILQEWQEKETLFFSLVNLRKLFVFMHHFLYDHYQHQLRTNMIWKYIIFILWLYGDGNVQDFKFSLKSCNPSRKGFLADGHARLQPVGPPQDADVLRLIIIVTLSNFTDLIISIAIPMVYMMHAIVKILKDTCHVFTLVCSVNHIQQTWDFHLVACIVIMTNRLCSRYIIRGCNGRLKTIQTDNK